jgi:hypothetical protein
MLFQMLFSEWFTFSSHETDSFFITLVKAAIWHSQDRKFIHDGLLLYQFDSYDVSGDFNWD